MHGHVAEQAAAQAQAQPGRRAREPVPEAADRLGDHRRQEGHRRGRGLRQALPASRRVSIVHDVMTFSLLDVLLYRMGEHFWRAMVTEISASFVAGILKLASIF